MKRREFLQAGLVGAAALATLDRHAYASSQDQPLRVGLIGTGWYGKTDLFHLIQAAPVDVVGLCDVDAQLLAEAAELVSQRQPSGKQPPTYGDYRKLLADQKPEIVLIGTPDHWHCLPMVDACRPGCDVYVQKPISWDVMEGQAMVAAARKYKRTVQVGLQRRSTPHILEARDRFIRTGMLGKIAYVDIHSYYGSPRDYPPTAAPPDYLDWETYVGPAPWRDYNPGIHPRSWRARARVQQRADGRPVRAFLRFRAPHPGTGLAQAHLCVGWHSDAQAPTRTSTRTIRRRHCLTTVTCRSSGTNATGARIPIPNTPGVPRSMATKAR